MKNKNKVFSFPPEEELEKVIKRFASPNYHRVNIGLAPNASELDKTKYDVCQSISRYKRENDLSEKELKEKMGITKIKLEDILFGRITSFSLDELVSYTEKLNGHMEIKIDYDGEKASLRAS